MKLLEILVIINIDIKMRSGNGYMCSCPFLDNHEGGTDKHASLSISENEYGASYYCFACGVKGSISGLIWRLSKMHNKNYSEALKLAHEDELNRIMEQDQNRHKTDYRLGGISAGFPQPSRSFGDDKYPVFELNSTSKRSCDESNIELPIISASKVTAFHDAPMPDYIFERNFDEKMYKKWKLGHDEKHRRLMFICYDANNRVVGVSGRLYWKEDFCFQCGTPLNGEEICKRCKIKYTKYYHSYGQWRRFALYGIHLIEDNYPVIITEGNFDPIRLYSYDLRNPVATFGTKVNEHQIALIKSLGRKVYLVGDGDKQGRKMNDILYKELKMIDVESEIIEIPDGLDPDTLSYEQAMHLFPDDTKKRN